MTGFIGKFQEAIEKDRKTWWYAAFIVVLFLAFLLRLWNLGSESAWIDEAYSISLAEHSISEIIKGAAADQHPPFYYLMLHFWLQMGSGVAYARFLSVILGVINVAQVVSFGKKTVGAYIGLASGLLLAISPMHVWYSQEIRMYILLACLTTASTTALWWALQRNRFLQWFLFSIFTIFSVYTHYFAFFVFFAQGVWVLIWAWKRTSWKDLGKWLASTLVSLLFFLPWLPTAINQARFHTMTWVEFPTVFVIRDTLLRLIFGSAVLTLPDLLRWALFAAILAVMSWAFLKLLPIFSKNQGSFYYIFTWGILPFTSISITALVFPVYQFKQYLVVLLPLLIISAWITQLFSKNIQIVALSVLVLSAGASLVYQQVTLSKDDWEAAALHIQVNAAHGDAIFGNPAASALALEQYEEISIPFFGIPGGYNIITGGWEGELLTADSTGATLNNLKESYQRLWLIEFFPEFWDPDKQIEIWLEKESQLVDEQWFGRIHVRLYNFH